MRLFRHVDLIDGCAVRLVKGDYAQKTIYSENPAAVARPFAAAGAKYLHVVDLEGAKDGGTPNLETIRTIVRESGLLVESAAASLPRNHQDLSGCRRIPCDSGDSGGAEPCLSGGNGAELR